MSTGTNKERLEQNNELLIQLKEDIDNLPDASSEILTKDENGVCVIENKINSAVVYGNSQQDDGLEVVNNSITLKQSGKNLAYIGWAEDFVNRIGDAGKAKIEIKDGRRCLHYHAGAGYKEYDTKYMFKINWKENTQYTFKFDMFYDNTSKYTNFLIEYMDGSTNMLSSGTNLTWETRSITSAANKTIKYLRAVWSDGYDYIDLDTFIVYEGTKDMAYESYYEPKNYSINLSDNYLAKVNDVKDELWIKSNGEYGKTERIKHIASYNGETITTDYISSTGALTTGAEIYYVSENEEEKSIGVLVEPIKLWEGTNIFELESNIPTDFEINYYKT